MTRLKVVAANRPYIISPDDAAPLAAHFWAVVRARVLDELTGVPPRGDLSIQSEYPGLMPRVATDGLLGLVGIPLHAFPNLDMQSYKVELTIRAQGYIPHHEEVDIAIAATFPDGFAPTNLNLQLRREPIIIRGRTVVASGNTTTPLAGMNVKVTGIWRTIPPGNIVVAPDAPLLLSLRPPLYRTRPLAAGVLRGREMVPVLGKDKHLLEDVLAGDTLLRLSDSLSLSAGDIIAVDAADAERREFLTAQVIEGFGAPAEQAVRVTLAHPLAYTHRGGALVRRVIPQAAGLNNQFSSEPISGDTCVFLNSMNDLSLANVVEIVGGVGLADEYHAISRFETTSDADGYYRLPALSRVAQLEIQVDDGGLHPTILRTLIPNYDERENRLDFIF